MKEYTLYNTQSGQILRVGYCTDADYAIQARAGESIVEGHYADDKYYWSGTEFILMTPKPGNFYYFDYTTKTWKLNEVTALNVNRGVRNKLLASSDWTQMPDVTISNKAEWATYRQTLRDMTEQQLIAGQFPALPQS